MHEFQHPGPLALLLKATLAVAWLWCSSATAAEFMVKTWDVEDGLPQSSVTDIAQTPEGYLWIGTLHSGLVRFDGVRFLAYETANTPAIDHPGIRRLLGDALGRLWIVTYTPSLVMWRDGVCKKIASLPVALDGLLLADHDTAYFTTADGGLLRVQREAGDQWGSHWLVPAGATNVGQYAVRGEAEILCRPADGTLARLAGDRFEPLPLPSGLPVPRVTELVSDRQGRAWLGTESELLRADAAGWRVVTPTNGEPDLRVTRILPVEGERLWIEANDRLRLCEGRQWLAEALPPAGRPPPWRSARAVRPDSAGGLWLLTADAGLVHVAADGALQWPGLADSRAGPAMRRLFVDARGNVWTGNDRSGLVRISPRLIQAVGRAEGLQDTLITAVTEATNGAVWVGTAGGSVARWNAGTWTNFALPGGTNAELSLVTADRHGRVWVSIHGNGLFVEEAGAFRRVLSRRQLEPGPRLLLADRADRLWLASYAGLFCYASNQLHKVLPAASNSDYAGAIAEGVDGAIWLGTFGGKLVCWRDGRLAEYFHRPPGRYVRFNSLSVDPDGTVWIGTLGAGLLHFRAGRFTPITTAQGLPANTIWQLQDDGLGHLWLGTRLGVVRVSKAELNACVRGELEQVPSRIFGRDDGLPTSVSTMEFHPNSWRGRDGRLWFATGNGVASLDPQAVRENAQPPPVLIEGVTVNGESRLLGDVGAGEVGVERALLVGPGRTTLEFHYTGLSLSAPERMRFAYQLEGLDSAWADAGGQRSAAYRYVPPGDYVFRVKACNSDGVWNEQGAALTVKVVPHFWQTGWFLAGTGLTTLAAVAMGVRAATRRRMQRRLQSLERQRELERERARIAQDLHDDLGAGLTEIGLTSELVQDATLPAEESREYAREIGGRARELVVALDEIVWAVNPRNDSLLALAAYFSQFAQHLCKPAGLRCRLDIAPDLPAWPLAAEQRHNLFLAFKEAVNNVVRHAGAREVRLTIALAGQRLVVTLQDDGCGFRPGATPEGADGLGNMRTRLQRLGGQCDIHSEPGQGTRVCLDLPLKVPSV